MCIYIIYTYNNKQQQQLRKVNLACFPVQYQEKYYKDVVERNNEGLCKYAFFSGYVVGAACARVESILNQKEGEGDRQRLYIMTLGVLAAYRGRGIGTQLIQSILDHYEEHKDEDVFKNVEEISLHVQISNDDAIKFYTERFGFVKGDMVENYYRRIDPPHCYLLYKKLREN
jgi:ribosomal protein S18 acetylase RimI-like enzyme